MRLSIVTKIGLSTIFFVLISAGVVGWMFHTKTTDIMVDHALKRIALAVHDAGRSMQQIVHAHDEDVLFLASTPPFQGLLRAASAGGVDEQDTTRYGQWVLRLETIFESLLKHKTNYHMVRFIDQRGQELVSVRRDDAGIVRIKGKRLENKVDSPYVRETLKLAEGEIYLSDINLQRAQGKVVKPYRNVFRIATPIYDEGKGGVAGLVVITFGVGQELLAIQERIRQGGEGVIYITNDHGGYLVHPDVTRTNGFDLGKRYRIQEDIPQLAEYFLPGDLRQHVTLMPSDGNGKDVVHFTKIPFDGAHSERFIAVIMTQDYATIVADEVKVLNEIALWALLLALFSMAVAVLFSHQLTRPIRQMTRVVDEYNRNNVITTEFPVNSKDEIGLLALSFKAMVEQVGESRQELEALNENLESMVVSRTDDLNLALVEANRANQAKSDFLARMSHELRTPMNAILGFGQILELDAKGFNLSQRDSVKEILAAGYHLLDLINDVLDLTKIESGNMVVSLVDVSVDTVVLQCMTLIQPMAGSRSLSLVDHLSGKGYVIRADQIRFKQVLLNLLSNAVKYNRENGQITLSGELMPGSTLRICITDNGNGLTGEDIDKLFTPFERLNERVNVEGAGIGLVISKSLVGLMGGEIGVDSILGEGSTFWVDFSLVG